MSVNNILETLNNLS